MFLPPKLRTLRVIILFITQFFPLAPRMHSVRCMRTLLLTAALMLHAHTPVHPDGYDAAQDSQDACEAYGGWWNAYANGNGVGFHYECDTDEDDGYDDGDIDDDTDTCPDTAYDFNGVCLIP